MSQSQPRDPTTTTTTDLNESDGSDNAQSENATSENAPAQPTGTSSSTDATTTTEPTHPAHDEPTGSNGSGETLGADTPGEASTTVKDPSEWVTGDEPMTGAQRSYLDTLARAAGEQLPADLNKAQASEHIDRLQEKTGRGAS